MGEEVTGMFSSEPPEHLCDFLTLPSSDNPKSETFISFEIFSFYKEFHAHFCCLFIFCCLRCFHFCWEAQD